MKLFVFHLAAASLFSLTIPPSNAQTAGRLLASNCFQCHATNGRGGFDRLAGKPAAEIFEEMKELQGDPATAEREKEIMVVHANGYTNAEIRLIAKFFASQK